jgi:hypothetical protein
MADQSQPSSWLVAFLEPPPTAEAEQSWASSAPLKEREPREFLILGFEQIDLWTEVENLLDGQNEGPDTSARYHGKHGLVAIGGSNYTYHRDRAFLCCKFMPEPTRFSREDCSTDFPVALTFRMLCNA